MAKAVAESQKWNPRRAELQRRRRALAKAGVNSKLERAHKKLAFLLDNSVEYAYYEDTKRRTDLVRGHGGKWVQLSNTWM